MYIEFDDVGEPIAFCSRVILKEAREEDKLVKQIVYTMISAYTNNPSNLAVNSPSGEGKSYVITKVGDIFPKEDVMFLQGMTDKALFHRPGVLVIQNDQTGEYEPIDDRIAKIDSDIEDKQNQLDNAKDRTPRQGLASDIKALENEKKALCVIVMGIIASMAKDTISNFFILLMLIMMPFDICRHFSKII